MKVVLRGSSVLFSLLGVSPAAPVQQSPVVLRRGSADRVQIGMSSLDVLAEYRERAKFNEKSGKADIFPSTKRRRPEMSLDLRDGVVTAIRVYSSRYKTEEGVGPGDSLIRLANQYPIHWTAENIAEVRDLNMKFQFEKDRIISVVLS
jgi:hypothetical protein